MITPRLLVWTDGALGEASDGEATSGDVQAGELVVADSWLLADGAARGLELHRARFLDGVASATSIDADDASAFWHAAVAELPRTGDWFPRFDAINGVEDDRLMLRIRTAPPLGASVRVASLAGPDPRTQPAVKGPDLERLLAIRSEAAADGVDEPVILSSAGHIVDGVTSAVLWWRGDRLLAPSASLPRVDSVTAKSLRLIAAATGTATGEEFASPSDLAGCEVWVVNALHGIRVVTSWSGGPTLARNPRRAALWQRRLDALVRPLL